MHASIPGLEQLLNVPQVKQAIATGDRHKVYRAIRWSKLLGRMSPAQARVAAELLDHPERFYKATKSAPNLNPLTGLGCRLYGTKATEEPGLFQGTHYLVVLFIPVLPLGRYLYSREGAGYRFYGSLPLTFLASVWRSIMGTLAALLGIALIPLAWNEYNLVDTWICNGLNEDVLVTVGEQSQRVPAGFTLLLEDVRRDESEAVVRDMDGGLVERISVDLSPGHNTYILNPLGAAFIYRELVYYTERESEREPPPADILCGERFVSTTADFPFEPLPDTVSLRSGKSSATKSHIGMAKEGSCAGYLMAVDELAAALPLLKRLADPDYTNVSLLAQLMLQEEGEKATALWADTYAEQHPSTAAQRMRSLIHEELGHKDALLVEYEAAFQADTKNTQAAYLYLRLLEHEAALELLETDLETYSADPYLARLYALHLDRARRYEEAIPYIQGLVAHPVFGVEAEFWLVETQMRQGRKAEALDALKALSQSHFQAAAALLREDPTQLEALREIFLQDGSLELLKAYSGLPLDPMAEPDTQLVWGLYNSPETAVQLATNAEGRLFDNLSYDQLLLLLAQAESAQAAEVAAQCRTRLESNAEGQELLDALQAPGLSDPTEFSRPILSALTTAKLWRGPSPEMRDELLLALEHSDPFGLLSDAGPSTELKEGK
jgi:hypothetical protein